jgi:uncharacterized protein YndB with AHSA1/START domain
MPKQKDLKRLIRSRMEKTGEAYTAARLQVLEKTESTDRYAAVAGMSDASVARRTGRTWAQWVRRLDAAKASEKTHREIVTVVSSLGMPDWWSQMVTVGYERIRGLRDRGQRRGGGYEATRSRTFAVPVERLFAAFANARIRRRWLAPKVTVRHATPPRYLRLAWEDGTSVQVGFTSKGAAKSSVAIAHQKLPDRSAADATKQIWSEYFDRLGQFLS